MDNRIREHEPLWGNWFIDSLIGEGTYGSVYKIYRKDFDNIYYSALKIISIPRNDKEVKRAYAEGMNEQQLNNYFKELAEEIYQEIIYMAELKGKTNIVSYEDHQILAKKNSIGYDILIRMELLQSLSDYSIKNEIGDEEVVAIGKDICRALTVCENHNIIHRDIKPDNIFRSADGDYKLGDFGIARKMENAELTMTISGSYEFMAPEILRDGEYDRRADIYSLGMSLYTLLNNRRVPFLPTSGMVKYEDRNRAQKLRLSGKEMERPVLASEELGRVILKACSYKPENRYALAAEFMQALDQFLHKDEETKEEETEQTEQAEQVEQKNQTDQQDQTEQIHQKKLTDQKVEVEYQNNKKEELAGRAEKLESLPIEQVNQRMVCFHFTPSEETIHNSERNNGLKQRKDAAILEYKQRLARKKFRRNIAIIASVATIAIIVLSTNIYFYIINKEEPVIEIVEVTPTPTVEVTPTPTPTPTVAPTLTPYEVNIEGKGKKEFNQIENIELLTGLNAGDCNLNSIKALKESTGIEILELRENQIADISPIANMNHLMYFSISNNKELSDISPLQNLTNLTMLTLDGNQIKNISPLKNLVKLQSLNVADNKVKDITVIKNFKELTFLNISGNEIKDITSLEDLTTLQQLILTGNPLKKSQVNQIKKKLPDCEIVF